MNESGERARGLGVGDKGRREGVDGGVEDAEDGSVSQRSVRGGRWAPSSKQGPGGDRFENGEEEV